MNQFDAGLFIQDDWRILPNLTLSPGLRYEIQNNIGDKADLAPRIGLAWGIGPGQGRSKTPNTVLRLGYGWFFTRFPLGNTLNADRFNGLNQVSYNLNAAQLQANPFLPAAALEQMGYSQSVANALGIPIPALTQYAEASSTFHVDPNLRAPRQMQTAIGVDRSLPRNMTLSVNFIDTRGVHQFQTVDINTPVIGTYPANPVYPLGQAGGVYNLYESGGIFKQNQLIFNMRVPLNKVSLQGYYAYGHVSADSASPSNPYNFAQDYGRAAYDIRHRVQIEGTVTLPWKIRLNPNISYQSAPSFNIVQGIDQYGTTNTGNARPAFEPAGFSGPSCLGVDSVTGRPVNLAQQGVTCLQSGGPYGNFVINPTPGMKIIPINYGTAFSQFTINMRLSRTWGFGERVNGNNNQRNQQQQQDGPGGQGGNFNGGGGGRGGGRRRRRRWWRRRRRRL